MPTVVPLALGAGTKKEVVAFCYLVRSGIFVSGHEMAELSAWRTCRILGL